jgi:hypothetical protein
MQQVFGNPTGHMAKHVQTLAALVCGIVGSNHCHLSKVADHAPAGKAKQSSLIKRLSNWLQRETITYESYFMPFAEPLIVALAAARPLELIIDGSAVGRKCVTLMVSVVYRGRALPLAWLVVAGKKGHLPEATHLSLIQQVQKIIPAWATVIFLGDGEFDGTELQAAVEQAGWSYVCRTAKNTLVWRDGTKTTCADMEVQPDRPISWEGVQVTGKNYGPVQVIAYWDANEETPIYLVTNLTDAAQAVRHYLKRAHIETFFSDQKSRGFRLDKSHLSNPARVARLLIATCLAYLWIIFLGSEAHRLNLVGFLHRTDRCDLSLFQLGMRLLHHLLKEGHPIPVRFLLLDCEVL